MRSFMDLIDEKQKKAGIYIRVSTKKQEKEGFGADEQLEMCQSYCEFKNLSVHDIYEDKGVSGTTPWEKRKGMSRLIADLKDNKLDCVVFYSFDRLARDILVAASMIGLLQSYKVNIIACKQNIDTFTEMGKVKLGFYLSIAQADLKNIRDRLRMGKEMKAINHGYVGGRLAYGYVVKGKEIDIDVDQVYIIRCIFDGYYNRKLSAYKIAQLLNNDKVITPRGGKQWYESTVKSILKNENKYRGCLIGQNVNDNHWPHILRDDNKVID